MNREYRLARRAFALYGVSNFFDLHKAYVRVDQELMKLNKWDPTNKALVTNKTKDILSKIDPKGLRAGDRIWLWEILWFWNHHAISYAIWNAKDKQQAIMYSVEALRLQSPDHPNKITCLLWYLVGGMFEEAQEWWATHPSQDDEEHRTGIWLIDQYFQGKFFK